MRYIKRTIVICFLIIVVLFVLNSYAYHEKNDCSSIESIQYNRYLDSDKRQIYTSLEEIKKVERKIRQINFYPSNDKTPLQESPTMSIIINYKDGIKKSINMVENRVLMVMQSNDGTILKEQSRFYYVNPLEVRFLIEE